MLIHEKDLALRLNVSIATIRRWRYEGGGPPFVKLGALVRYVPQEIEAWIRAKAANTERATN